jgi:hypothetical protein
MFIGMAGFPCVLHAVALGADSFIAGAVLGPFVTPGRRTWLAASFGLFDGAASLLGGSGVSAWMALPAALPICAAAAQQPRHWILMVPAALCLDNLTAAVPLSEVPALTVSSALLAAAGLWLGRLLGPLMPSGWQEATP